MVIKVGLEKKPFRSYRLDEERQKDKRRVYPVSLNLDEQNILMEIKNLIEQDQDSKAIRQTMHIAHAYLIHDKKVNDVLGILFKNKRNNARRGVVDFD
jgi:hypothetical protein